MTFRRQICKTITQFTKVLDRLSTENEEYETDLCQGEQQHQEAFSRHAKETEKHIAQLEK